MQGRSYLWISGGLALLAVLAVANVASAQMMPDLGYQQMAAAEYPSATAVSYKGTDDLAREVAELREWKESVEKKEAEAKKKAAGAPTVQVGGRIYVDTAMFNQNGNSIAQVGDADNGSEFRTTRIFVKGKAFHVVDYKLQFDISGNTTVDSEGIFNNKRIGQVVYKDVYMSINELPFLGHLRLGHFKEPFSIEQLTSSRFITFMERSLGDEGIFVPGRNMGVMAFDWSEDENMTWAIGGFVNEIPDNPPLYHNDHGQAAVTMRLTWLPWYDEATNGRGLLHLGAGYSYRSTRPNLLRLRSHPESHLAPYVLDTGLLLDTPNYQLYNAEAAYVYGPFSAQAEYFGIALNRIDGRINENFNGCYLNLSYFLTGENRVYDRHIGSFTRVKPFGNFFRVRDENCCIQTGIGAWEIAYRFSHGNLIGEVVNGGRTNDHTVGLNWYLNPYMRMMFNYIHSTTDDAAAMNGNIDIFQMRAQIDF
ncbi:MAG: hypothetical protein JXM70_05130 [Pirellulales bacterium]|nr:hypothetical protein [Pirellulales bacterium]